MKLYIIRHGETIENKLGITQGQNDGKLSDKGVWEVEQLAQRLKNQNIDIIYSSDLGRSKETTEIIAKYHPNATVFYDKRLREGYKGPFEGMTHAEQERIFGPEMKFGTETRKNILENHPEVEKFEQMYMRAIDVFREIKREYPQKDILISAHEIIDIALIHYIEGKPEKNMFNEMKKMKLENASMTSYIVDENKTKKIAFNDITHTKA